MTSPTNTTGHCCAPLPKNALRKHVPEELAGWWPRDVSHTTARLVLGEHSSIMLGGLHVTHNETRNVTPRQLERGIATSPTHNCQLLPFAQSAHKRVLQRSTVISGICVEGRRATVDLLARLTVMSLLRSSRQATLQGTGARNGNTPWHWSKEWCPAKKLSAFCFSSARHSFWQCACAACISNQPNTASSNALCCCPSLLCAVSGPCRGSAPYAQLSHPDEHVCQISKTTQPAAMHCFVACPCTCAVFVLWQGIFVFFLATALAVRVGIVLIVRMRTALPQQSVIQTVAQ